MGYGAGFAESAGGKNDGGIRPLHGGLFFLFVATGDEAEKFFVIGSCKDDTECKGGNGHGAHNHFNLLVAVQKFVAFADAAEAIVFNAFGDGFGMAFV